MLWIWQLVGLFKIQILMVHKFFYMQVLLFSHRLRAFRVRTIEHITRKNCIMDKYMGRGRHSEPLLGYFFVLKYLFYILPSMMKLSFQNDIWRIDRRNSLIT